MDYIFQAIIKTNDVTELAPLMAGAFKCHHNEGRNPMWLDTPKNADMNGILPGAVLLGDPNPDTILDLLGKLPKGVFRTTFVGNYYVGFVYNVLSSLSADDMNHIIVIPAYDIHTNELLPLSDMKVGIVLRDAIIDLASDDRLSKRFAVAMHQYDGNGGTL